MRLKNIKGVKQICKMKNNLLNKLFISFSTIFAVLPANYLIAGSHELEISLQNCDYAKTFAKTVMEKRKASRTLEYYDQVKFTSPVAMEIVFGAYETDAEEPNFSDEWFEKCLEISCNEFWADLEIAVKLVLE